MLTEFMNSAYVNAGMSEARVQVLDSPVRPLVTAIVP